MSKVKNPANKVKHTKAQVTHHGFDPGVTSACRRMYNTPPPDSLSKEDRIQPEVQNRLRQLADNAKPGTEKNCVSKGMFCRCDCEQESSGNTNSNFLIRIKTGSFTPNCL